ncbi:MAG: VOC family protein [Caulobacter sp.]|nr:VOC family protein [Caulobacter sp.]
MRPFGLMTLLALCAAAPALAAPAAAAPPPSPTAGSQVDHALLWGRRIDEASDILGAKLGFQVRPGRDPGGVANRFIRFEDGSYIEVLGLAPGAQLDPGMQADQDKLHGAAGSRSLGLRAPRLDALRDSLLAKGAGVTPIFEASPNDPDGLGPGKPPRWRLFAIDKPRLSSTLFFIDYAPPRADPASTADRKAAQVHPNGTRKLSQFWLLSADPDADRAALAEMGYGAASPVRLPNLAAKGYCVPVGQGALLLLAPDGPGLAADALEAGGPQVLGISLEVEDLARARRLVERGYGEPPAGYAGPLGESFLAPTRKDLGLVLEFHEPRAAGAAACGAA